MKIKSCALQESAHEISTICSRFLLAGILMISVNYSVTPGLAQYAANDSTGIQYSNHSQTESPANSLGEIKSSGASREQPIVDVNTSGSVRVNMLANLDALIGLAGNGAQIVAYCWAAVLLVILLRKTNKRRAALALIPLAFGAVLPQLLDVALATARDANWFG